MDQIATGGERRARIGASQALIGIQFGKRNSRTGLAIHNGAGVFRRTVRAIRACREQHHVRLSDQQSSGCEREMLIASAASRIRRQLHRRFAAPNTHLGRIQM